VPDFNQQLKGMIHMSVFESYERQAFPHKYRGQLRVRNIAGGTPSDPKVAEAWLRSKFADPDTIIYEMVNEVIAARGAIDDHLDGTFTPEAEASTRQAIDEAIPAVAMLKHLNGFKRDSDGVYIEGRQLKAGIKEAASVAVAAGKLSGRGWGKTNKGLLSYVAEHIFVVEERLHLGVAEPDRVEQRFVHTWRGTGIQYEEIVDTATIDFTITTDHDFTDKEWAMIWLTGEQQGIGASRSQGHGRYEVITWEPLSGAKRSTARHQTAERAA
jgi:hypothetical protein